MCLLARLLAEFRPRTTQEGFSHAGSAMAKRFTDGEIWKKPWFRSLTPAEKSAWFYIKDNCDSVGVWTADYGLAEFQIGGTLNWEEFPRKTNGNIEVLDDDKWLVTDFVEFQYGALSKASKPHQYYIRLLEKHGLDDRYIMHDSSPSHKAIRQRITQRKRDEVFLLAEFACQYCGQRFSAQELTIDHLIPIALGGTNDDENLVAACLSCNSRKGDRNPHEWINDNVPQKLLNGLLTRLHTLSKKLDSLKEKEKDKDKEREKEKDKEKEVAKNFEIFYAAYPRKKSRKDAEKAFRSLAPDESLMARMLAAINEQSREKNTKESFGLFAADWKYPATWLRSESWQDEVLSDDEIRRTAAKDRRSNTNGRTHTPSESEYRILAEKHLGAGQGAE